MVENFFKKMFSLLSFRCSSSKNIKFLRNFKTLILFPFPDQSPPLFFGESDLHQGPRADLPSVLVHLRQQFVLMGIRGRWSPNPETINLDGLAVYENYSNTLKMIVDGNSKYTQANIEEHAEYYKSG